MNAEPLGAKVDLMQTDEELQTLSVQHQQLDDRLHELTAKHHLSEPEHVEEVTLKKKKLQLKDRMEELVRRQQNGRSHE